MGIYFNPGHKGFQESLDSEIYVDKTGLITVTNKFLNTRQKYLCVSRPRRFGKSMAADMLAAYYTRGADSTALFQGLAVCDSPDYPKHRNQYNVIKVNMQEFLSAASTLDDMLPLLQRRLRNELLREYPDLVSEDPLVFVMQDIFAHTGIPFVILIDEWDCLFREYPQNKEMQRKYLDFLRLWLKDQEYVALAYMTGILPIKKYGTHSALNMFTEYSMTDPGELSPYFGFTESEVRTLCKTYQLNFDEIRGWYDGYHLDGSYMGKKEGSSSVSIYNPKSVVEAMQRRVFGNYWNRTETYEALRIYIQMNMDGLKDAVISILGGEEISTNTDTFTNDMTTFTSRDDILTLLIHLGYLTYHTSRSTVSIPNKEVAQEYVNAIKTMDWSEVTRTIENSHRLLESLWALDGESVAAGIEQAHQEISSLHYHDENSLCCTIQLAFYYAREYYNLVREFPTGKGFADICMIPRKAHPDRPAAILELKWNQTATGAIAQILERNYPAALADYQGDLILAGINYDKKSRCHTCVIQKFQK